MLKLIKTTVLDASAASVTISNIPQEFKTLKLIVSARIDSTNATSIFKPNNSSSNLSERNLNGNGATAASTSTTSGYWFYHTVTGDTASTFSNVEITIPNYSGSTNKPASISSVTENNGTTAYQHLIAGLWSNTSAITSIVAVPFGGNYVAGSTFYLYGIA